MKIPHQVCSVFYVDVVTEANAAHQSLWEVLSEVRLLDYELTEPLDRKGVLRANEYSS